MRQEVLLLVRKMLLMFMMYAVDVLKVVCCGGGDFASVVDRRGDGGTAATRFHPHLHVTPICTLLNPINPT